MDQRIDITDSANLIACDLAKVVYEKQLKALVNTLDRFQVPARYYTLMEARDESTCMLYEKGTWRVFYSERGQRSGERMVEDAEQACMIVMREIAEDENEYAQMVHYFQHLLQQEDKTSKGSFELYRVIKEGLSKIASSVAAF